MATLTNFNPLSLQPSAAPLTNNLTAGPDQFAPQRGGKYLLRFNNPTGVSFTVKLDDPTSITPVAAVSFDPDVSQPVPNAQVREMYVDSARFMNSSGFVSWTYSAGTGVGSTVEITGPLNT